MSSRYGAGRGPGAAGWRTLAALVACVAALAAAAGLVAGFVLGELGGGDDGSGATVTVGSAADRGPCRRPYAASSPWNTPIAASPRYDPAGTTRLAAIGGPLTSDPTQYTYPVYEVSSETSRERVEVRGRFSDVTDGGRRLELQDEGSVRLPIPPDAEAARGSDAQIIVIDRATGDEWGAWQLEREGDGWSMKNGYHYNVNWGGVPPREEGEGGDPFGSRGAGVPYLAGLVRPCEIERGRIDHALAFAYRSPSPEHVYPATKSDGKGFGPGAMPEGTRLRLDPSLTPEDIEGWGCSGPCLVVAQALQRYGMYVIDASGRAKVMLEYESTADWGTTVDSETVSPIPLSALKVVQDDPRRAPPER